MRRYSNTRKTVVDGITFDSRREACRYQELKLCEQSGVIRLLRLQPKYRIVIGGVAVKLRSRGYPNGRQMTYIADFEYYDAEKRKTIIEDVKMQSGFRTEVYKIKKALMEAMGYEITEV